MESERPAATWNQIERGIEEALRDFTGRETAANPTEITAAERINHIGNTSAPSITEASELVAKDIEEAAQPAVDIAADIMKEAQSLASDLRANGKKISAHLHEFAGLARTVSTAMRDTRAQVVSRPGPPVQN
jgi:vacuolar-type H+-ATPase subunit H